MRVELVKTAIRDQQMKLEHKPNYFQKTIGIVLTVLAVLVWIIAADRVNADPVNAVADNAPLTTLCAGGKRAPGPVCPPGWELPPEFVDFLQFDEGTGTTWDGWTYSSDVVFGLPGWFLDIDEAGPFGGGFMYSIGQTRSHNKGDYGLNNLSEIDATVRSPRKATGGSQRIYNTATDGIASWWIWYDGKSFGTRGLATSATNRLSFYTKIDGLNPQVVNGVVQLSDGAVKDTVHFGTYLCWQPDALGSGYGCPKESSGNQHYYHTAALAGNQWVHLQIDNHPTHKRSDNQGLLTKLPEPALADYGKYYFENMNQMYFETYQTGGLDITMWIDDFRFWATADSPEPDQNDISISSVHIGYHPGTDLWTFGFIDNSITPRDSLAASTYQIRYSTQPITNANWDNATIIQTIHYSGLPHTDSDNNFRKPKFWYKGAWDQFTLPDAIEANNNRLFFAIKDVSVQGHHAGTTGDHVNGDLQNSPSAFVKTIDYYLRAN